jgi:hypothetical protein
MWYFRKKLLVVINSHKPPAINSDFDIPCSIFDIFLPSIHHGTKSHKEIYSFKAGIAAEKWHNVQFPSKIN